MDNMSDDKRNKTLGYALLCTIDDINNETERKQVGRQISRKMTLLTELEENRWKHDVEGWTKDDIPMKNIKRYLCCTFYDAACYDEFWNVSDIASARRIRGCCNREIERDDCCANIFLLLIFMGIFFLISQTNTRGHIDL